MPSRRYYNVVSIARRAARSRLALTRPSAPGNFLYESEAREATDEQLDLFAGSVLETCSRNVFDGKWIRGSSDDPAHGGDPLGQPGGRNIWSLV